MKNSAFIILVVLFSVTQLWGQEDAVLIDYSDSIPSEIKTSVPIIVNDSIRIIFFKKDTTSTKSLDDFKKFIFYINELEDLIPPENVDSVFYPNDSVIFTLRGMNAIARQIGDPNKNFITIRDSLKSITTIRFKSENTPKIEDDEGTRTVSSIEDAYLEAIKCKFPNFQEDDLYKELNTNFIFVYIDDGTIKRVPGTILPDCNSSTATYRVYFLTSDDAYNEGSVIFEAEENLVGSDLVGLNAAEIQGKETTGPCDTIKLIASQPIGPYDLGIDITVRVNGESVSAYQINIPSCSIPYHFSIVAGFYASTLNNPDKIVAGLLPNHPDSAYTLYANNATSQKALTVMAVFYPTVRDRYYDYRDLGFWEKWSFCFGTKLSQELFDNLFLGINYEFAKGGSFATGVHYGQHTSINGFDRFKFGEDVYPNSTFSSNDTREVWNYGIFFGVNIDPRVVFGLRGNAERLRSTRGDANENQE